MLGSLLHFASSDIHVSLKAEPIAQIGPLTVTNSMLYGILSSAFIILMLVWAAKKISIRPKKGWAQFVEMIMDYILSMLEGVFGSRKLAIKFAPIFGSFFIFILVNNTLGLLPVVGPSVEITYEGVATPLLRPFTADLNATIAMAVAAILMVQVLSIKEQGGKKHLQHYFTNKPWNPLNFFIGVLEVFGELTRILSLSLRLFLNTAVGEILIAVFTSLVLAGGRTPLAALPIILFEVLVAGIQAYVFTVLSATYLGLAISHAHDDEHGKEHQEGTQKQVEIGSTAS